MVRATGAEHRSRQARPNPDGRTRWDGRARSARFGGRPPSWVTMPAPNMQIVEDELGRVAARV